jgi:hypothetical protein
MADTEAGNNDISDTSRDRDNHRHKGREPGTGTRQELKQGTGRETENKTKGTVRDQT